MFSKKIFFIIIFSLLFGIPFWLRSASYDLYVDKSTKEDGTGSQNKPFKTIGEAIKEAEKKGGLQRIFIKKGIYEENLKIKKSIKLYGENEKEVTILGAVEMENETSISNLTVKGKGKVIVTVADGANVQIESCVIYGFSKIGIETWGRGKLKVANSKIKNSGGKGFYIQMGKTIEITNCEIAGNYEEGIDIRSKTNGIIENNLISNNGESGIEVIVGSANLIIRKNNIYRNGSSGIAAQFYPEWNEKGKILLKDNKFRFNTKFGLDCNIPHGGKLQSEYWKDSIELIENEFSENKIKAISDFCDLIDAVDENEQEDNVIVGNIETLEKDGTNKSSQKELIGNETRLLTEEKEEKNEEKLEEVELGLENQQKINSEIETIIKILETENKLKIFFFGYKRAIMKTFEEKLIQKEKDIIEIEKKINEIEFNESEEEIAIKSFLENEKQLLANKKQDFLKLENSFNFWKWLKNIFFRITS